MRGLSVKAILIANVAAFAIAALVFALGLVITILAGTAVALFGGDGKAGLDFAAIAMVVTAFVSAPLGAGYVAGRIGRDRSVLNGTLATIAWTLLLLFPPDFGLHTGEAGPELPEIVSDLLSYGAPFFGVLGGYLAKLRTLRLAAVPVAQRSTMGPRDIAMAAILWLLAFPSALMVYFLTLKLSLKIGAHGFGVVFAVVAGVVVATAVAPGRHRLLAGSVFMTLATGIPAEELVRHAQLGDLSNGLANLLSYHLIGSVMAYLALLRTFPREFRPLSGHWWWLSTADYRRWTPIERHVRLGLVMTAGLTSILSFVMSVVMFRLAGLDGPLTVPVALMVALLLGVRGARPIYRMLYPEQVRQAD